MKNVFNKADVENFIGRIDKLTPNSKPLWGKMSVETMLAHCNVTYELEFENIHPKPEIFTKLVLKIFVKKNVVNDKPNKKNSPTGKEFIIKDARKFEIEKKRIIDYLHKTNELGQAYFSGKESHSFGVLTLTEWNNLFSKHLDHHLQQFAV